MLCLSSLLFWHTVLTHWILPLFLFLQRLREDMDEITQQQLVHDKYCKELMTFGTKPRHITPFTSFQSVQPPQSNALLGLLGYSSQQCFLSFGAVPVPSKSTLVESRYCRELMEERFDQVCSSSHRNHTLSGCHNINKHQAITNPSLFRLLNWIRCCFLFILLQNKILVGRKY